MESKTNRKRKKHPEEFKREAVRLLETRGDRTVADVAASLGVAENLLQVRQGRRAAARRAWWRNAGRRAEAPAARECPAQAGARGAKKIGRLLREGPLVSPYELVHSEKAEFPVGLLCEVVGISRSAHYAWCKGTPSQRQIANERLLVEIRAIHAEHQERYGSPRIRVELAERGLPAGKHRVARLMRENGLRARPRRRFRRTTDSRHRLPVAPNLLQRRFDASRPDEASVGDITYIWPNEGWAYLAVIIDLFSRRVVGWALRKSLALDLAMAALQRALTRRRPDQGWCTTPTAAANKRAGPIVDS